jgi:hypothetical protein
MLQLTTYKDAIRVSASSYTLTCATDRPYIYLADVKGKKLAELFVLSSVHTLQGRDDTVRIDTWQTEQRDGEIVLSLTTQSSLWRRKTYRFRCAETRFTYEIELEGEGHLTEALYFSGYYSGQVRWGSGFFWSGQRFKKIFNPEPTVAESYRFNPSNSSGIDLAGVPLPGKAGWFFTPPPFCFVAQVGQRWMSMGVEAAAGENRFTQYQYHGQQGSFHLSLSYEGYTHVSGVYTLPALGFDFAADEYEALTQHVAALQCQGYVQERHAEKPNWWYEPIFCGWGTQCYAASIKGGRAPDYARQLHYEESLATLEFNALTPGIVVLDDKWQNTYGANAADEAKWPNLRGFVDAQHAAGRKVLLWLKAWDPEGIPADECITNAAGLPLAVDPTNPAFERRFRETIRTMLSADGYDADGFKIDFTARIPTGPGARLYGDIWGLELMKRYLFIIYDEAKKTKPDALVMSHTPHPYLADVLDMIRLNDINMDTDVNRAMTHRARVSEIACPDAIVDTDNWPITNRAVWRKYITLQPTLGVPSLYYVTHIDSTGEPLQPEDYALIRQMWETYRSQKAAAYAAAAALVTALPITILPEQS